MQFQSKYQFMETDKLIRTQVYMKTESVKNSQKSVVQSAETCTSKNEDLL